MAKSGTSFRMKGKAGLAQNPNLWLLLILLLFAFIRFQFLGIPFERDEGAYALYGRQILQGGIPYIDFHAMKYPFLFYFYAGVEAIFGDTLRGIQVAFILLTTANVWLIYLLTRKFFDVRSGLIAAAGYAILSFHTGINGFTCQSEHVIVLFILLAGLVVYQWIRTRKWQLLLLAGVLAALGFQIKQTAAFLVLFLGLVIIAQDFWKSKPGVVKALVNGAWYTVGFLACLAIFGIILMVQGAWEDFLFWTVTWPKLYVGGQTLSYGINMLEGRVSHLMEGFWPLWIAIVAGVPLILVSDRSRKQKVALVLLFVLSIATIVPGLRFYGHYWIQLLPGFCMVLGVGMSFLRKWLVSRMKPGKLIFALVMAGILLGPVLMNPQLYFSPNHTQVLRETYGMNPFPEMKQIGDYLKPRVMRGETLAVFGAEPELYFYTNTVAPSSYSYFSHIVKNVEQSQQWQQAFLDSIEVKQPRYIVFLVHTASWDAEQGAAEGINNWSQSYLNTNYALEGVVDMIPDDVQYVFGEQARGYKPRSSGHIFILRRFN